MKHLTAAKKHLQAHDPYLARIITATPKLPPLTQHTNYYQALVESIIGQQLSVKAAASIDARFKALFNGFPTPEQILERDIEELHSAGLSRPKARYIQDLARHIISGEVRFDALDSLSNEEIASQLTQIKGIGEWTVHMFLIFCMGRLDVLPTGDLGIRSSIKKLYNLNDLPSPDDIRQIAKKYHWHPYESVASWYIWQALDNIPEITPAQKTAS
jgi:DNA-3-methyladenine glycosylase II